MICAKSNKVVRNKCNTPGITSSDLQKFEKTY